MGHARGKTRLAGFLAFICAGVAAMNAAAAGEVVGWMEVAPKDGQLQITGRAWSAQEVAIDYVLQIQRSGRSGSTTSKQGGKAVLRPGETAVLSASSVSSQPQDQFAALLTIYRDGQVLATSAMHTGEIKN